MRSTLLTAPLGGLALGLCTAVIPGLSTAVAEPARYELDPDHLSVGFLVDHVGYAKTLGMFRQVGGSYTFDETTGELTNVVVTIETDSVFTNHRKRDEHLRSADFLNSAEFPQMVFRAASATPVEPRRYRLEGTLELLGQTRPVSLDATWNKSGEYPFGGAPYVMGVSARGTFARSDFGMDYSVDNGWVGDEIALIIEFEARRQ